MNPILKSVLAVIAGIVVGSVVNMAIIMISVYIIPPPAGVDVSDMESLKQGMALMGPEHFLFPFLAHAAGTFVGAYVAALLAFHKERAAITIGLFFLLGGILNVYNLAAPVWFSLLDLVVAYLPMAWIGRRLAISRTAKVTA
jgi:hypothetical protein